MNNDTIGEAIQKRGSMRDKVSEQEWDARVDLAACYRLCVHYGWTDLIYNHISLRVPGTQDQFLINAFGLLYEEVTASNLVKIDIDGNSLDEIPLDVNRAGFVIHAALHKMRHDATCIFHTHTKAGTAVSCHVDGLLPISQHALRFHNRVGYHDYEGIALDLEEQERLVRDLGNYNVLILRNHGLLTCGKSVRDAFELMYYLEMACQIQVAALAGGGKVGVPPQHVCERTAEQFEKIDSVAASRDWYAMRRLLDRRGENYAS